MRLLLCGVFSLQPISPALSKQAVLGRGGGGHFTVFLASLAVILYRTSFPLLCNRSRSSPQIFYTREDTEDCVKYINGTTLDGRPIRVDFDWGFKEGRQFGRGKSGGQIRDEYRVGFDSERGGYGEIVKQQLTNPVGQVSIARVP